MAAPCWLVIAESKKILDQLAVDHQELIKRLDKLDGLEKQLQRANRRIGRLEELVTYMPGGREFIKAEQDFASQANSTPEMSTDLVYADLKVYNPKLLDQLENELKQDKIEIVRIDKASIRVKVPKAQVQDDRLCYEYDLKSVGVVTVPKH